jgi:hypothetical protein
MAKRFFVRVQLHDVTEGDAAYQTLHDEMETRGFLRIIKVGDEVQKLPTGSYHGAAEKTGGSRAAAGARVGEAVATTGHTASYVVVETDALLCVSNLEPYEQPKSMEERLEDLAMLLEEIKKRG